MRGQSSKVLTIAEKCKNILASNWQGNLNTVKANAEGSKQEIHTSRVKYLLRKGKPYIWIPEQDLHNTNALIDERASFAVTSPFPGPLGNLLKSLKKFPTRVALSGEIVPVSDGKVSSAMGHLQQVISSEQEAFVGSSYAVSEILSSSSFGNTSRSESLLEIFDSDNLFTIYKLNISSCMLIDDGNGGTNEVEMEELAKSKADKLSSFATKIIDGINQSEDAYMRSVDRKGFDVLAKVVNSGGGSQWKEYRFTFQEEAPDAESFCKQLVEMEEAALQSIKSLVDFLNLGPSTATTTGRPIGVHGGTSAAHIRATLIHLRDDWIANVLQLFHLVLKFISLSKLISIQPADSRLDRFLDLLLVLSKLTTNLVVVNGVPHIVGIVLQCILGLHFLLKLFILRLVLFSLLNHLLNLLL
ncbi:hypothetical protein V2J09_001298 [Rumex salicifolius]